MSNFIDDLMDLNPDVQQMFAEPEKTSNVNPDLYKTNPNKVSKDVAPDGHYYSKVRIIYNPFDKIKSLVSTQTYKFNDAQGFFMVDSVLSHGDKNCPFFKAWKALHYSKDEEKVINYNGQMLNRQEWGDTIFEKNESTYCLVQIIEDQNQPELVGRIMGMKLPKHIKTTLMNKMNPTDKSKAPVDIMNYLFGPVLAMDVIPGPDDPSAPERKNREISYTMCQFDESEPQPIIKVDGTQLFTDEELDAINDYYANKKIASNPKSTAKKKEDAKAKCGALVETIKPMMAKALEYLKENSIDLVKTFGYKEPTAEQMERAMNWLKVVNQFQDPVTFVVPTLIQETGNQNTGMPNIGMGMPYNPTQPIGAPEVMEEEDDLPF